MKKKQTRYSIKSIDDLPSKLCCIDLTRMVLMQNDDDEEDFTGFKTLLESFYEEIRFKLLDFLIEPNDEITQDEYLAIVSDYILRKLHSTIWS